MNLPTAQPKLRRSPLMVVAGVILVIAGALGAVGVYAQISQTEEVIVVVAAVARGEQIKRGDLAVAQVGFDPLLTPIPASQLGQVIGQYALADLVPGTFVTAAAIGGRVCPAQGEAQIGLALLAGEYPDDNLLPGDRVLLVAVPDRADPETTPLAYRGTLVSISPPASTSLVTMTVLVSAADAPTLAALSAAGRLALVLTTRER